MSQNLIKIFKRLNTKFKIFTNTKHFINLCYIFMKKVTHYYLFIDKQHIVVFLSKNTLMLLL